MSENTGLVDKFVALTGVDAAHATSFLDAYNWDFDAAVDGFFDSADDKPPLIPVSNRFDSDFMMHQDDLPPRDPRDPANCDKKFKGYSREGCCSNIATLASLAAGERQHSPSSNSDDEEGQAFYAGGSVHSGQQVLGPSRKAEGGFGIVKEMVKSAVRHGAKVVNPAEANREATQVLAFKGVGHVLGSTTNDSVTVSDTSDGSLVHDQPLEVCLKAWRNGFTIDDGPLRDYNDPENKAFLDDVRNGEVPQELTRRMLNSQGPRNYEGEIHISLEDHSHEEYQPPKQTLQAFTGTGYRLGSPTPAVVVSQKPSDNDTNEKEAKNLLNIDESQPVTQVQVRLSDGSRLEIILNHNHTVNDIRQYIVLARPEYGSQIFTLMNSTSYPFKEITDDSLTVKEANLFNGVLVLRIK